MTQKSEAAARAARSLIDSASAAARARVIHHRALDPGAHGPITSEDLFEIARQRRQADAAAAKALENYVAAATAAIREAQDSPTGEVGDSPTDNA